MNTYKSKFISSLGAPKTGKKSESGKPSDAAVNEKGASERIIEGVWNFLRQPSGVLMIIRLILLIVAAVCFNITAETHESYTIFLCLEISIILFFIITYTLTVNLVLLGLDWPLMEILNLLASAVFLLLVGIVALREKRRSKIFYIGGITAMIVALLCLLNVGLICWKKFRDTKGEEGQTIQDTTTKEETKASENP